MKFYKYKQNFYYRDKIINNNLSAIYCYSYNKYTYNIIFFKNGKHHNTKNAAFVRDGGYKSFYLNRIFYGNQNNFTKKSWHRFVKMNVFL
jgi:hypothetical protein